jgi:hypothetical protein
MIQELALRIDPFLTAWTAVNNDTLTAVYHTLPGKVPALESIFRDVAKLQDKHGLNVVGYWVPNEDPAWADAFIHLIAHPGRDEAKKFASASC